MSQQASVSLFKRVYDLQNYVDKSTFNEIRDLVGITNEEFDQRSQGYDNENEFLLALSLCGITNNITVLDESYASVFGINTCDVLLVLKNGNKMLVEIKSTNKERFETSKKQHESKKEYANEIGAEFFYSIKLNNIWMLIDSDRMEKQNYKIGIDCLGWSKLSSIFNCNYYLAKKLLFKSYYKKTEKNTIGIFDKDYGYLSTDIFYFEEKQLLKIKKKDKDLHYISVLSEALRDRCSDITVEHDNDITIVTYKIIDDSMYSAFEIALATVYHMIDENDEKYDAKKFLDALKESKKKVVNLYPYIESFAKNIGLKEVRLVDQLPNASA